jgi:hypothetical protein
MLPCKECLVLAICYNDKYKMLQCDLLKKFVDRTIFEHATSLVKNDCKEGRFYWYITDHPTNNDVALAIGVVACHDKISFKSVSEFKKV